MGTMAKQIRLVETTSGTSLLALKEGVERVDRESGVLRGIKLLGYESKNDGGTRRYHAPDAALYENVPININHPDEDGDGQVAVESRWGVTMPGSVQVNEAGVFADIEYDPHHPRTESNLWWAEKHPDQLGMSHVAFGFAEAIEDKTWLTVTGVESVDLVTRPATTGGFFEHATDTGDETMEFKEQYEAEVAAHAETKAALAASEQKAVVAEQALAAQAAESEKRETEARRETMLTESDLGEIKPAFRKALMACESDEDAKALIESVKPLIETEAKPRSASAPTGDSDEVKTYEQMKADGLLAY